MRREAAARATGLLRVACLGIPAPTLYASEAAQRVGMLFPRGCGIASTSGRSAGLAGRMVHASRGRQPAVPRISRGFKSQSLDASIPFAAKAAETTTFGWYSKLGLGTVIVGSPLALEHHRRGQLPGVVSSHGRDEDDGPKGAVAVVRHAVAVTRRTGRLLWVFAPAVLLAPFILLTSEGGWLRMFWYKVLRQALEQSGAAFIKWGQWASTRADMFPKALCQELSHLHQGAPTHSLSHTLRCIEEEFGRPVDEIFSEFDPKPLASGSVAQVYKGSLHGREGHVAVKVRHPGVEEQIRIDFCIMSSLASVCSWTPGLRWLNLQESLLQFSHTMSKQTDLECEADHLIRFNHYFWGRQGVSFPAPIHPFVSDAVLVETFEPAPSVSDYTSGRVKVGQTISTELSPEEAHYVVRTGKDIYLQMVLADGVLHADLHPGNILLRREEGQVPQLVLVDAGMVAELKHDEQNNFISLFHAMGAGDGAAAARSVLSFAKDQSCEDPPAFEASMSSLFTRACRGFNTDVDIGEVLRSTLELIRQHHVRIDSNYATLVINVLCIEGIARDLMPEYNLLDGSQWMLRAHSVLGTNVLASLMPVWNMTSMIADEWEWVKVRARSAKKAAEALAEEEKAKLKLLAT